MYSTIVRRTSAIAAVFGLAFAATAYAQTGANPEQGQQAAPPPVPQEQAYSEPVSDEKVEQFVSAYTDMQGVREDYAQQLHEVEDPEQATAIQQEAQEEMQNAITEAGLSIDEYQDLAARINQDQELLEQVQQELARQAPQ